MRQPKGKRKGEDEELERKLSRGRRKEEEREESGEDRDNLYRNRHV
jgi:hypothetical protein